MSIAGSDKGAGTRPAAVFLDRDGTLIEDRGHLREPSQVVFFPRAVQALAALQRRFRLFIVTNQSGVAGGMVAMTEVRRVNRHVVDTLHASGVTLAEVYVCPHHRDDGCACIKPNSYFPQKAAREHGIDLSRSYSVGDHPCDVELGTRFGGQGLYVLTGHGRKHRSELPDGTVIVEDLQSAADWILSHRPADDGRE
ncbi:D-glycero-alpha-D-manno-heptose-1,7-bisphosphate 7-phosphatase [Kiritimatiella glycovorans]|uniref:D,D-heptose 1,7-bisphosphate phosphatase n=1 Tax=Kiritimatiella glycovorans TaxID=1307763 RepID=A0A0G3EH89_9BACT|nr:HAD-IIIA family hydrolase [Kiritimatiella glycovorans]AKJ64792.1 D,D-heptose 1,7-bisphosphate phosphatase [Kiritimatiella glycovorans]